MDKCIFFHRILLPLTAVTAYCTSQNHCITIWAFTQIIFSIFLCFFFFVFFGFPFLVFLFRFSFSVSSFSFFLIRFPSPVSSVIIPYPPGISKPHFSSLLRFQFRWFLHLLRKTQIRNRFFLPKDSERLFPYPPGISKPYFMRLPSMTLTNYHYVSRRINFRPARRRREAMRWHR